MSRYLQRNFQQIVLQLCPLIMPLLIVDMEIMLWYHTFGYLDAIALLKEHNEAEWRIYASEKKAIIDWFR